MAKIYKAELYILDMNDEIEDVENYLKYYLNGSGCLIDLIDYQESRSFEWHDDLKINHVAATKKDYDKYFK